MNNSKQNKISWPLDNKLDLSRNRVDIDSNFSLYKVKNSPMYNEAISPLYTETEEFNNRVIYGSAGDRFYYENGILYMNNDPVVYTDGDGYFTRQEVNRDEYDTYDIDNDDNTLWSKYNHGVITYHTPNGDYTYTIGDTQAAVLNCRARIINSTPIIVYLFVNTNGKYELVYLKDNITYNMPISHWMQRKLPLTKVLAAGETANRQGVNGGIVDIESPDINDLVRVNSPIIQIANPADDIFIATVLTDHGGKLKPSEIGYITIIDYNNTFYNKFDWNRSSQTVEIDSNSTLNLNFKTNVEHKNDTILVYQYYIDPNGPADFEVIAKENQGKFFLGTAADPSNPNVTILVDEVKFDPGYEPDYTTGNAVQGNYQIGSGANTQYITYTKWISYQAITYTDKWTMTTTVDPFQGDAKNAKLKFKYTITPKKKIIEDADSETQFIDLNTDNVISRINEALVNDIRFENKEFSRFEYQTNWSTTLNPIVYLGNEDDINLTEDWKYVDLNNTANNRLACLKLTKHDESNTFIYYDVEVLFRAQNITTKTVDTVPTYFKFIIEQSDWTGPNDINGLKTEHVISDFKYMNFTTCSALSVNYKQLVNFNSGISETNTSNIVYDKNQDWKSELGRDQYFYWIDADPITYNKEISQSGQSQTITFNYEYTLNNTDYRPAYENPNIGLNPNLPNLFEGFTAPMNIDFKTDTAGQGNYAGTYEESYTTPYNIPYINANINLNKTYSWTFKATQTQNVLPNIFLDDGTAVSVVNIPQFTLLPTNATIGLHCKVDKFNSVKNNAIIFDFTMIGQYASGPKNAPGCVWDLSIDLASNYYRMMTNVSSNRGASTDTYNAALIVKSLYDTGLKTTLIAPGATTEDTVAKTEAGSHYYNLQGSITKLHNKFRQLINSCGIVSGISYGDEEYIGTLLAEWNSVSEDKYIYFNDNVIGYHSSDGKWYEIKCNKGDGDINIIFDRYIIINTNGFWNCYDIERKRQLHYASDFNNRVFAGASYENYGSNGAMNYATGGYSNKSTKYSSVESKFFVSGINSLYEVSGVALTSIQFSPQSYIDLLVGSENFCWCKQPDRYVPQYIEVFYGQTTDNTMADYQYSEIVYDRTNVKFRDNALIGLNAPVSSGAQYYSSPNIFTKFIHTYNNKDLVINGKFSYPIVYNETTPILSYSSAKQISNVDNVFVIQSQFYGIINDKIVSITYDDYTIIAIDAIIDIKGMIYLGYLPTMAYFFSPADRCIYTFTGDANLDIQSEATGISKIYNIYYNTASESIFVATDIGVIVISGKQMWKIDVVNVDNIYFIKDGYFIIIHTENNKFISTAYSYEPELLKNPIKQKVILESKYVGPGSGKIATTDNLQIIIISEVEEAGEIKLESSTFTDTGFKSESKIIKISKDLWKNGENALVCNFFPKYQTGQGFKWRIESDFAIDSVIQSISERTGATLTQLNG